MTDAPSQSDNQDIFLLKLETENLQQLVREALEAVREGDLYELGDSPLADSGLTTIGFLHPQPATAARGRALQAILQWGVDQLKPGGERDWQDRLWLNYNILQTYYLEDGRIADIAEASGYSDIHMLQTLRPRALKSLTRVLRSELAQPHDTNGRQQYCATALFEQGSTQTRQLLSVLAVLENPIPHDLLRQLLPEQELPDLLQRATQQYLVTQREDVNTFACHPILRQVAKLYTPPPQQQEWLTYAATYFSNRQEWVNGIALSLKAGQLSLATELIQTHWESILASGQEEEIQTLQKQLQTLLSIPRLRTHKRPSLQLLSGKISEYRGEFEEARQAYNQASQTEDPALKGQVFQRLAELSKRQDNIDFVLAYYQRGIAILKELPDQAIRLASIYIDRASIYLQERPDYPQAQLDLQQAETLLTQIADPTLQARLHNGWASYYYSTKDKPAELEHRLQAWLAAVEANDLTHMLNTSHNLGQAYAWRQQYENGLTYLQKSLALAEEAGNQQVIAANHKTIGNIYFWQEDYPQAETHYQAAYQRFAQIENRNWLGYVCYELTEVYAHLGQWNKAQAYWREGTALAEEMGNERLGAALKSLHTTFPLLESTLNERQQAAVAYMVTHQQITNKIYCELNDCSQVTAARDLKECVASGVMVKVGKGRSTHYILV